MNIEVQIRHECPACNGSGFEESGARRPTGDPPTCRRCNGARFEQRWVPVSELRKILAAE